MVERWSNRFRGVTKSHAKRNALLRRRAFFTFSLVTDKKQGREMEAKSACGKFLLDMQK